MVFFEPHGVEEQESFHIVTLTNFSFPLHFHRAYELIIVHEGRLRVTIDQKEYFLQQNEAAFIFNNQMHEFTTAGHSAITIIIFSPELIGRFFMDYKGFIPVNNTFSLSKDVQLPPEDSVYRQKSFLYGICSTLEENTDFKPVQYSAKTKILHQMLLYVDNNYAAECTLKAVAEHLQYDYPYLSKLFVQMAGMTFTEYLNYYRISRACYLLKSSQQPIGEIAADCGYSSLRSFNRNFQSFVRDSPRRFREISSQQA